jgi:hypothetical protein
MNFKSKFGPILAFIILGTVALALGYSVVYATLSNTKLPQDGWQAGFHAYHGAGYESVPVQVFSVKSHIEQGLTAASVRNKSDKNVKAVRFGWYVSESKTGGTVLARGETALVSLELTSNQKSEVTTPRLNWDNVLKPAMRNGALKGDYDIWIVVKKVIYDDGSEWSFPEPTNVSKVLKLNAHYEEGCANQTCKKRGGVYKCEDADGELCTNHGEECTSSICTPQGN